MRGTGKTLYTISSLRDDNKGLLKRPVLIHELGIQYDNDIRVIYSGDGHMSIKFGDGNACDFNFSYLTLTTIEHIVNIILAIKRSVQCNPNVGVTRQISKRNKLILIRK